MAGLYVTEWLRFFAVGRNKESTVTVSVRHSALHAYECLQP